MDKKSKYGSARDRLSSIAGITARNAQDNFATDFIKYSEEYNVHPLPRVVIKSIVDLRVDSAEDDGSPIFYLSYEKKKLDTVNEIECKDEYRVRREVSICILDALNATLQRFNTVTVLKLPDCRINAFGIMIIAEMLITIGCLRDLNLDSNPNPQENYYLLCNPAGSLWYLSLNLCKISDNGVEKMMKELRYQDAPREPVLIILSLANNLITNDGAAHVANMLRTNRSLKCLVLLGNRISDKGASMILRELKIITLTHEEIMDLRLRKFNELTLLDQLMEKENIDELNKSINGDLPKRTSKSRRRSSLTSRPRKSNQDSFMKPGEEEYTHRTSEDRRNTIIEGIGRHPFQNESYPTNGEIFATGNLDLQYLDLSYNYLTKTVLQELIGCLRYQNYMLGNNRSKGLLHILLEGKGIEQEGNNDWTTFEELLQIRREENSFMEDSFREFVSEVCEILRQNIRL